MNKVMMKCGCAAQGNVTAIQGRVLDRPMPACVVHDCYEPALDIPDLTGRTARCAYGAHADRPSATDLAFFEYRGPDSREAVEICQCGYTKGAHESGKVQCKQFTPKGPEEHDRYYCGCRGWD